MALTGGGQAVEEIDNKEGLDALAAREEKSQRDEAADISLDGLRLTPTAVQQEVSQDPFTGSSKDAESPTRLTRVARHAGLYLSSPLYNALNPEHTDFDAGLRLAWLRLDKHTRWEIGNRCEYIRLDDNTVDKFAHLRSYIISLSASMPRSIDEVLPLEDATSDAASELPSEDIVYTGTVTEMGRSSALARNHPGRLARGGRVRVVRVDQTGNHVFLAPSFVGASGSRMYSCVGDRIEFRIRDNKAVNIRRLAASPLAPTCLPALAASRTAAAPMDDDLLREIAFDAGRPRQADEASEVSGVTVSSRATFASRATSAYTALPTAHGATRMQQRAVALRDLQTAKKYGTITQARDGARGDKRWKIEFGGFVYITDELQKLVITTYQIQPRVDSLYIGPDPPPPTYPPPPIYLPPAPYMPPIVEGSIPLFQPPPPPPMILRSTAWPVAPPLEVKISRRVQRICAGCGRSLRKAAFSKTQWRTHPNRPRCIWCTNYGRAVPAEVKLPPPPATVAVSVAP